MPSPEERGANGKTYAQGFGSFRDNVLDVLEMPRSSEKFKREVLSTVMWHPGSYWGVRYETADAAKRLPGVKLKRDHVHTRRALVQRIFDGADPAPGVPAGRRHLPRHR